MEGPDVNLEEVLRMKYERRKEEILRSYKEGYAIENIAWKFRIQPNSLEKFIKKESNYKELKKNRKEVIKKLQEFNVHIR